METFYGYRNMAILKSPKAYDYLLKNNDPYVKSFNENFIKYKNILELSMVTGRMKPLINSDDFDEIKEITNMLNRQNCSTISFIMDESSANHVYIFTRNNFNILNTKFYENFYDYKIDFILYTIVNNKVIYSEYYKDAIPYYINPIEIHSLDTNSTLSKDLLEVDLNFTAEFIYRSETINEICQVYFDKICELRSQYTKAKGSSDGVMNVCDKLVNDRLNQDK